VPVLALKAGADLLLMPPDTELAYTAVLDAVLSGELSEQRVEESVYRVLRLKFQRGLFLDPFSAGDDVDEIVGAPGHMAMAQEITDRTVTLVKDDLGLLPLSADEPREVFLTGWGSATLTSLGNALGQRGQTVTTYVTGQSPGLASIHVAAAAASASDLVVVSSMRASQNAAQRNLIAALRATGTPVIVIAVREPYDIAYMTGVETYLATYSYKPVALESVTRVLFGEIAPQGRLPVWIPSAEDPNVTLYDFGHGLSFDE
jgi:beta-N-acetylhexosaminidase